jgi:hypothetical protein
MKKFLIILAATGSVAMSGCKKFLDVNENPNNAVVTDARYVFTNAQQRTVANQVGGVHTMAGSWVGFYGHSTSFTGGGQEKTYVFTNNDFNYWDGMYDNITDYQYVIDNASKDNAAYLVGPAKIMRAYVYQKLVDLYGDVPYTEAMSAATNLAPKYDNAQTVYEDLIVKLTEAIADIKAATFPSTDLSDITFKANKTNWIRMANTLKLRILLRQSNMPGRDGYITGKINEIVTEGTGFLTDNAYVQPGYTKTVGKLNPFYNNYGYSENDAQVQNYAYRKMGSVIVNFLKNTGDLFRLSRIAAPKAGADPTLNASYVGIPLGGDGSTYLEANTSSIGSMQIVKGDATRPSILMTAAEAYFLRAEAAVRYAIAGVGDARTNYESGVRWAFRLAAATQTGTATATNTAADAAADTYLASGQDLVDWDDSPNKLRTIWVQKYLALVHVDGLEAWSEYRRTNSATSTGSVPTSPHSISISASAPEPARLYYPLREQNVNSTNYKSVNVFTNKIFWDVN